MTTPIKGFRLRFLGYFGPQKKPATVKFGPGLNVLYGASDTGKSFIVETVDLRRSRFFGQLAKLMLTG